MIQPTGDQVDDATHLKIWEQAIAQTSRDLPVHYARACDVDGYGLLGLACKTAPDLRTAIERMLTFVHIVASSVQARLDGHTLVVQRDGNPGLGRMAAIESTLGEIWVTIGQMTVEPVALTRVELAHPPYVQLNSLFGCPVEQTDRNALVFADDALRTPLKQADCAISAYFLEQLRPLAKPETWTERVAQQLETAFAQSGGASRPGVEDVARALAVSPRTLQRHLQEESSSFRTVLEHTRLTIAKRLLITHAIGEVAFALGFSESSAFHRWFRKSTGMTPGAFRDSSTLG